jgi:hypothetical protein
LTNDCHPLAGCGAGYVSAYTLATGNAYTDATLDECTISRGRQNEPAVPVDPRNTSVLLGSSNDYCGVYNRGIPRRGGRADLARLLPLAERRKQLDELTRSGLPGRHVAVRRALAGTDGKRRAIPVIAWDAHGRAFFGSETSGDPAGTAKTFGDEFVARFRNPGGPDAADTTKDGLEYYGTTVVAHGSSAPNLLGVFHDKTAIEADRTGGVCDGNVYFSWSRFNGNGVNSIYFARSTDHGVTFSSPLKLSASNPGLKDLQFPDISVTHNGNVYVTFRSFAATGSPRTRSTSSSRPTAAGRSRRRSRSRRSSRTTRRISRRRSRFRLRPSATIRLDEDTERTVRPCPRLRRLRRRVHLGLHVLPPRHAGAVDGRPARRGARVGLHGLRRDEAGNGSARRERPTARTAAASAARPARSSSATTGRPEHIRLRP